MPPSPQILEPSGEKYALIVGLDNFRDGNIPSLRYARNDAEAVRDFLLDPEFGKFKRENVHVLLDEEATLGDIRSQLVYWLGAKVREQDHVWIYFAGCGTTAMTDDRNREHTIMNYLIMHDTNPEDLAMSALALNQLEEWLDVVAAERLILIFDCGFSGFGKGRTFASNKTPSYEDYAFFSTFAKNSRRMAVIAAGPMESACEDNDAAHGLFTRILLQRLRMAVHTERDYDLTWEALQQFLAAEVSRQAELRGGAQTPVKVGGLPGHLPLFDDLPQPRPAAPAIESAPKHARVQQLLREAQQELYADNLYHARELLLEILELDANNRRALNGLRKLEEVLQQGDRETQIKQAFSEARRHWDERNYIEATRWYGRVLELDPTSESARVGIETCQSMLQKQEEENDGNGALSTPWPAMEKPLHAHALKMKGYDEFIWPYVGWWALVGVVWGLFGTHTENASTATTFITALKFGFFGGLIGLVHASAVYFYKLAELRLKAKKARKA
ncbi:caspase family protein [candidate division KSB1 bacterium]|nr:caspase family protein [candidate division KSB1 bacterium]